MRMALRRSKNSRSSAAEYGEQHIFKESQASLPNMFLDSDSPTYAWLCYATYFTTTLQSLIVLNFESLYAY